MTTIGVTIIEKKVEAVTEVDAAFIASVDLGDARPAVNSDVIQKRRCRANESARLSRAVARRMWACLGVDVMVIIGWSGGAAMGSIWALDPNALHQELHAVASAVATCGDATQNGTCPWP